MSFERIKAGTCVGKRIFIQANRVRAFAVGFFVGIDKQGPVDVLVNASAQLEKVLGGEAAARMDV